MPEGTAIATTKRKFYKALDNFSASQTSLSSTTAPNPPKRPATAAAAFEEATERAKKRLRHSTSSSSSSLPIATVPAPTPTKKSDRDPPNFSPWSHHAFLARLKTFSRVSLWHPKPEGIGEVEWAKRGWVCVDVNTVGCRGGCERRVVVSLGSSRPETEGGDDDEGEDDEAALELALTEKYRDQIVEGHGPHCMWRKEGCGDDIYRLQVVRPSIWQPELRKRYTSILAIRSSIEKINLKPLEPSDPKTLPPSTLLTSLPTDLIEGENDKTKSEPALEIALHGWRASREAGSDLLNCDACFQRLGLWMYQPDYRPPSTSTSAEDGEEHEDPVIDLVEMHREHCPWRNASTQKATGTLRGLNAVQILLRVVSTCARDQRRRSDESREEGGAEVVREEGKVPSREEVALADREREGKLRRLKAMFSLKRRGKSVAKAGVA